MNRLTKKIHFAASEFITSRDEVLTTVDLSETSMVHHGEIIERRNGHSWLIGPVVNKLAAYEDIGLDPEELKELVKKHVPKPAKVTKEHHMERSLTGVRRHTITRYSCPECKSCILEHHITETLDQYDGYRIDRAYVNPDNRTCSCGQLVSFEKEEKS